MDQYNSRVLLRPGYGIIACMGEADWQADGCTGMDQYTSRVLLGPGYGSIACMAGVGLCVWYAPHMLYSYGAGVGAIMDGGVLLGTGYVIIACMAGVGLCVWYAPHAL